MNVHEEIDRVSRYRHRLETPLDGKVLKLAGDRDALIVGYQTKWTVHRERIAKIESNSTPGKL